MSRPGLLALRKVEQPAVEVSLEDLVHEVEHVAAALFVLHDYLAEAEENDGAETVQLLHLTLARQVAGLRSVMGQKAAVDA